MSGKVVNVHFTKSGGQKRGGSRMKAAERAAAERRMNEMFGMALDVVYEELEMSNPKVAMWFADQHLKKQGHRLNNPIDFQVNTTRDLEEASKIITLAAANGEISFQDCKELQEALARHAVLSGLRTVEDLRGKLDELKQRNDQPKHGLNGYTPTWGRLSEGKEA